MKRFSLAIVATAGLMLASCGGNEDTVNEADVNAAQSEELNDLSLDAANDAANTVELDTLGNQAAQLEEEATTSTENIAAEPATPATDDEAMNVSGM